MQPAPQPAAPPARRGFTLIELLITVVIISILAALLLPALNAVRTRTRDAAVKSEIMQLETAIGIFKQTYGIDPPSRITICENSAAWSAGDRALIRRIWPQFDFTTQDRNGDGDSNDSVTLNGSQCLIFFLGGVVSGTAPDYVLTGFSKNPLNPGAPGGNREGPFFEFDTTRLRYTTVSGFTLATYLDPLPQQTNPYLYFSSYGGAGYNPVEFPSGSFSPYRVTATGPFYKPQTCQIISPGVDGLYGSGGAFDPNSTAAGLGLTSRDDYDNLTNFHGGRLIP